VSDTPRTDRWIKNINGWHYVQIERCRELEQELNAANERIKRLEDVGDKMAATHLEKPSYESALYDVCAWDRAKEAKP
jgi:hypothetical protein